jgi:hypothetical protein
MFALLAPETGAAGKACIYTPKPCPRASRKLRSASLAVSACALSGPKDAASARRANPARPLASYVRTPGTVNCLVAADTPGLGSEHRAKEMPPSGFCCFEAGFSMKNPCPAQVGQGFQGKASVAFRGERGNYNYNPG